jgi:hypothetical protein
MCEERPPGLHEHIAASIIHAMNSDPQERDIRFQESISASQEMGSGAYGARDEVIAEQCQVLEPESAKEPVTKKTKKKS